MARPDKLIVRQTAGEWECIDGRPTYAVLLPEGAGQYRLIKGKAAAERHGPQVLGASLGFVATVMEIASIQQVEEAFAIVEEAHRNAGYQLQYHIDTHALPHGINLLKLTDEKLKELMLLARKGCGFAAYYFQGQADDIIALAQSRGWGIQLLMGDHAEKGARRTHIVRRTFDTAAAAQADQAAFNQDVPDVEKMVKALADVMVNRGLLTDSKAFIEAANTWLNKTFIDVVEKLTHGQVTADKITDIR